MIFVVVMMCIIVHLGFWALVRGRDKLWKSKVSESGAEEKLSWKGKQQGSLPQSYGATNIQSGIQPWNFFFALNHIWKYRLHESHTVYFLSHSIFCLKKSCRAKHTSDYFVEIFVVQKQFSEMVGVKRTQKMICNLDQLLKTFELFSKVA